MESPGLAYIRRISELAPLLERADYIDIKTVSGSVDLRTFLANMFSYQPDWITALYAARAVFVRFLGMRQRGIPRGHRLPPETIPMQAGMRASFFKVYKAEEEHYWVAEAKDTHLNAILGIVVEPSPDQQRRRFHVLTVVHYQNWAGPIYFRAIQPFHHLVVGSMARAGVDYYSRA